MKRLSLALSCIATLMFAYVDCLVRVASRADGKSEPASAILLLSLLL